MFPAKIHIFVSKKDENNMKPLMTTYYFSLARNPR